MGSPDPILTLLKDFSYNVVRLPRTGIRPLQILEKQGNDLVVLGEVLDLFEAGSVALPAIGADEQATFINGKRSRNLSISVGLSLLGGIIGAMTGTKVKLDVGYKKASALAFEFHDVKVNQVNQLQLSKFLTAARIDESVGPPAKLLDADKLYLITNTIKSRKFTAEALKEDGMSVEVDVPIIKSVLGGAVGVKPEGTSNSKITYEGDVPLVFGFQAARMEFDKGKFKGFKQIGAGETGMRGVRDTVSQTNKFEMLETEGSFVSFFNLLPEDEMGGGVRKGGAKAKSSSGKNKVKSSTKKATKTKSNSGVKSAGGKSSAGKKSAKKR
jgi:hypothetical protein